MTAQTTTQRTAAHRRRRAEKLARYEAALREIAQHSAWTDEPDSVEMRDIARKALV